MQGVSKIFQSFNAAMLLALFSVIFPSTVQAFDLRLKSQCWIAAPYDEDIDALILQPELWHCADEPVHIDSERHWERYDIAAGDELPRYLLTRRAALKSIDFVTFYGDGQHDHHHSPPSTWQNSRLDGFFRVELPPLRNGVQQIFVAYNYPSHLMTLDRAYLAPRDAGEGAEEGRKLLLLAALCGMLLMPLIFNFAFYRVLRESFVVWHSALVISLLISVVLSSGLAGALLDWPVMTISGLSTFIFGVSVAMAAMFTRSFVEPDKLHPMLREGLRWAAGLAVLLSSCHALFPFVMWPVQSTLYALGFAPILLLFIWALVDALWRGSRAAKYQAVGWMPMVLVGCIRLITGVMPGMEFQDAMMLFYFACVFEVLSTAMGVADRFMSLKDQRDRATTEAEILEMLVERDSLTGLSNRRGIENHFESLYRQGYRTMALLDLDHFKSVNDVYGHVVGDEVLKATAIALAPNDYVQSFRMGGEEFLLLLRGQDPIGEAENRRQAIERRVMRLEPLVTRRVTASMGIIRLSQGASGLVDFYSAFERADKLLYEAKIAGRNCSICEETRDGADLPPKPRVKKNGEAKDYEVA